MKICAYVPTKYAKENYKTESLDQRQFVGLKVIRDTLIRHGYNVEYAGKSTVHEYDLVLVSITSDCDWWPYIAERTEWRKGSYMVIVGGAGVMNIRPFLPWADYFVFGRGEPVIVGLVEAIQSGNEYIAPSVACAETFSVERTYTILQSASYKHDVAIDENNTWHEGNIGCNHRCKFCAYTWHRKQNFDGAFMWDSGAGNMTDKECALLDFKSGRYKVDFSHLRTTAIDGFSERLRFMVDKRITNDIVYEFLRAMIESDAKPHQIKIYNVCGYPTETESDWWELLDTFRKTEGLSNIHNKQWSIVLHTTPFRAMPATPMACAKMSYRNYRGEFGRVLGSGLRGNLIYQGKNMWCVESMGTESLPTVVLSAIAHRGTETDTENVRRICISSKFWDASAPVKQATLEKYFDVDKLFSEYNRDTLPTNWLRSWAKVENAWPSSELAP